MELFSPLSEQQRTALECDSLSLVFHSETMTGFAKYLYVTHMCVCVCVCVCFCVCVADSTGTHSLYTRYQDYEIMFHVSTMLPYTANNTQQVK